MNENETEKEQCPCCDRELPLGLFAHTHLASLPLAIRIMTAEGEDPESIDVQESVISAAGRTFLLAEAPLPLSWPGSPVRVRTWVECDSRTAARLAKGKQSGLDPFIGEGSLASDLAFFSGSIGAPVSLSSGDPLPTITRVADDRVLALPNRPSHEQLVAIYRSSWGNPAPVTDADPAFRTRLNVTLQRLLGRPCYRQPVEPPAPLAGISPAEVLISPPFDVGEEAVMATLGCAEVSQDGPPTELVNSAFNPSPSFVKSFSEFCYLSRLNNTLIGHGLVIPERSKIPDTSRMDSWVLLHPSLAHEDVVGDSIKVEDREVQLLLAVPLYPEEANYIQKNDINAWLELIAGSDADLADLRRPNPLLSS